MSSGFTIDLDEVALHRYLHTPDGDVFRWVRRLTDAIGDRARLSCPVRTGRLRNSLEARVGVEGELLVGTVESGLAYARPVHDRTRGRPFLRDAMVEAARDNNIW